VFSTKRSLTDSVFAGDEGLGPGGLSAAWRAWPEIKRLMSEIRQHAPQAFVLLLTSPVGLLARVSINEFPENFLSCPSA
jgi:alpha-galactosidase/6-phospho-beta-glucosidase family protein